MTQGDLFAEPDRCDGCGMMLLDGPAAVTGAGRHLCEACQGAAVDHGLNPWESIAGPEA